MLASQNCERLLFAAPLDADSLLLELDERRPFRFRAVDLQEFFGLRDEVLTPAWLAGRLFLRQAESVQGHTLRLVQDPRHTGLEGDVIVNPLALRFSLEGNEFEYPCLDPTLGLPQETNVVKLALQKLTNTAGYEIVPLVPPSEAGREQCFREAARLAEKLPSSVHSMFRGEKESSPGTHKEPAPGSAAFVLDQLPNAAFIIDRNGKHFFHGSLPCPDRVTKDTEAGTTYNRRWFTSYWLQRWGDRWTQGDGAVHRPNAPPMREAFDALYPADASDELYASCRQLLAFLFPDAAQNGLPPGERLDFAALLKRLWEAVCQRAATDHWLGQVRHTACLSRTDDGIQINSRRLANELARACLPRARVLAELPVADHLRAGVEADSYRCFRDSNRFLSLTDYCEQAPHVFAWLLLRPDRGPESPQVWFQDGWWIEWYRLLFVVQGDVQLESRPGGFQLDQSRLDIDALSAEAGPPFQQPGTLRF